MLLYARLGVLLAGALLALLCGQQLTAQGIATPGGVCKPVSQRTQEVGCWILIDDPIGRLTNSPVFWHLDAYPARAAAQADKGPHGLVIESLGKIWALASAHQKSAIASNCVNSLPTESKRERPLGADADATMRPPQSTRVFSCDNP